MRSRARGSILVLLAVAALFFACSESAEDGADTNGSGGSGATGGASGGSGPGGSCLGACGAIPAEGCRCDLECESNGDCCEDFVAECKDKLVELPAGCVTVASFFTLCNPVTNEGCDTAAHEACDFTKSGLECWKENNTEPRGATCAGTSTKYCIPTYTCDGSVDGSVGVCHKFCCSNADCGGGTCKPFDPNLGTLGACQTLEDGDAGDAEADGAGGTDGGTDASDAGGSDAGGGAAGSDAAPSDAETDGD